MITLIISDEKAQEIMHYAWIKKLTGNWMPDIDPIDWLALEVMRAIAQRKYGQRAVDAEGGNPESRER